MVIFSFQILNNNNNNKTKNPTIIHWHTISLLLNFFKKFYEVTEVFILILFVSTKCIQNLNCSQRIIEDRYFRQKTFVHTSNRLIYTFVIFRKFQNTQKGFKSFNFLSIKANANIPLTCICSKGSNHYFYNTERVGSI